MSVKNEWKPIDSALKTGRTLLLGYWNSHGKWRTVRGQWMSAEYIGQEWDEPDGVEAGWFETAVEANDVPNCWPVSPSHWQPMPEPPCPTCDDQGAVGNILTAQPCPDCTPAPSAPGDAQDEQRAQDGKRPDLDWIEGVRVTDTVGRGWCVRIDGTDIFEDVNRYGCKGRRSFQIADGLASKQLAQRAAVEWLSRQLSALDAPAAGDALDAARYRALVWVCEQGADMLNAVCASAGVDEEISPERLKAIADAALAAQVPQQGEA